MNCIWIQELFMSYMFEAHESKIKDSKKLIHAEIVSNEDTNLNSATIIQKFYRRHLEIVEKRNRMIKLERAATLIQTYIILYMERRLECKLNSIRIRKHSLR